MIRARFYILSLLIFVVFSACSSQDTHPIPPDHVYRSPTQIPTLSSTTPKPGDRGLDIQKEGVAGPTPTPDCFNNLLFIKDVTIPDGTLVDPGDILDKRWAVQNNGSCNWNERYRVKLIAGPGMGMPVQQALYPALSGTEVVIRMVFIAPDEAGYFRSAWQAYDPQDIPFGDPFFIDIVVAEANDVGGGE
jgi:hypothetical protein